MIFRFSIDHCIIRHVNEDILDFLDLIGYEIEFHYYITTTNTSAPLKLNDISINTAVNVDYSYMISQQDIHYIVGVDFEGAPLVLITEGAKRTAHIYSQDSEIFRILSNPENDCVDCGNNELLFQAAAALRKDSDKRQWLYNKDRGLFTYCTDNSAENYLRMSGIPKNDLAKYRKATTQELLDFFADLKNDKPKFRTW